MEITAQLEPRHDVAMANLWQSIIGRDPTSHVKVRLELEDKGGWVSTFQLAGRRQRPPPTTKLLVLR